VGALLKLRTGHIGVSSLCTLISPLRTRISGFKFMCFHLLLTSIICLHSLKVVLRFVIMCQDSERAVAKGMQVDAMYPLGSAKYQGQTC
jgi:hypothetical protein